jgi:diguanylate cyclase (GGDEF)-like protein/putative nucleotidyltransferase with HDIG domain
MSNSFPIPDSSSWIGAAPAVVLPPAPAPVDEASAEGGATEALATLLGAQPEPLSNEQTERALESRLGLASALFIALRCKHADTAAHSIRVALGVSAWADEMQLPQIDRNALEVAALLHDVGKIGVPDRVLLKPGNLNEEEQAIIDRHRLMGGEILSSCCGSPKVLDIINHAPAWYNGKRMKLDAEGDQLPLEARMLAIVDAYDSMTSPHVYRPARSHERAMQELFECSGTQFDPVLVRQFAEFYRSDRIDWAKFGDEHWLTQLDPTAVNFYWQLNRNFARHDALLPHTLFHQRLLENMYDAVIFVDANRQIMLWNRGAERLTGIAGSAMYQRQFETDLVQLRDEHGEPVKSGECPVGTTLRTGTQLVRRMVLGAAGRRPLIVDVQTIPVAGDDGTMYGSAIVLHDASGQVSLEERCLNLHQQATRDPLTQLANRAEFDRVHALFVGVHLERNLPCSLIITDIDRFKLVNDNYGHQAGDEAIKSFAQLLKANCHAGDLAARYGGEEFVILCANCNNATAASRAEELRKAFAQLPQHALAGASVTASFGVTELQPGDTPETMLRRADRALLQAKDTGRNKVVQLGSGIGDGPSERRKKWWWPWQKQPSSWSTEATLVTGVPLPVAVEKLRGFIADHYGDILHIDHGSITVEVNGAQMERHRRTTDRRVPLVVELHFSEEEFATPDRDGISPRMGHRTRIEVSVRAKRSRDRRRENVMEPAKMLIASLRAYLMAVRLAPSEAISRTRRATRPLWPWLWR